MKQLSLLLRQALPSLAF